MIDFLELLNGVARVARPAHHEFVPVTSMNEKFVDSCFDSMDMMMIAMYMAMIYDIDDEIAKDMRPETVQEMFDLIQQHKRQDPESVAAALELIK